MNEDSWYYWHHGPDLDTCPTCGNTDLFRSCDCDANLDEEQQKEKYRDQQQTQALRKKRAFLCLNNGFRVLF